MSGQTHGSNTDDVAPGFTGAPTESVAHGIGIYLIGVVLAALLTVASFSVVYTHLIWGPAIPVMLGVLAVAQIGVHLVFFLHLTTAPDNTNNVLALAFGVLIVALLIGGSLWIMDNLNQNMLPMYQMMQMQR
ncbi:MAG TPA: cytochrome o ubiquinol oxidase subunit IV [Acetobacteraceae bacterium]